MKKVTAVIMAIIMLIPMAGMLCSAESDKTSMVVLGDSIAEGIGAFPITSSYSYIVANERNYELHNLAYSGAQSYHLYYDVTEDEEIRDCIRDADIIEISIGGNDFLQHNIVVLAWNCVWGNYSDANRIVDNFRDNYEYIIDEIRYLNPDASIIVQTLYNPVWWMPAIGSAYENVLTRLNESYYVYTETDPNYTVINVHDAFDKKIGLVSFDFTHPSPFGHMRIADVLSDELDRLGI